MFARHYHRHPRFRGHASLQSFTPKQVAALYNFPSSAAGQKLGFVSLGGDLVQSDLDAACKLMGVASPQAHVHLVAGAAREGDPGGADVENILDATCQAGGAPGAEIHMFLAPNTDSGFAAAVQAAVDADVDALSISWGAPEDAWSTPAVVAMNAAFQAARAKGINIFVASGDNGSGDGERGNHVDFPASSVYVVGCGGTSIRGTAPLVEQVWNDGTQGGAGGGGVSVDFALPAFQKGVGVPSPGTKRGVPDIALNADPESGYVLVTGGEQTVVGGTSAAAPMAAALCACLQVALGRRLGDWNATVYPLAGQVTRDITAGNNGTYVAKSGYDCCTGIGVPDGKKLLAAIAAPAPQPAPTPTPTPPPATVTRTIAISGQNLAVTVDGHTV